MNIFISEDFSGCIVKKHNCGAEILHSLEKCLDIKYVDAQERMSVINNKTEDLIRLAVSILLTAL